MGQRRVVLVPEESQGTPQSVQDREPPSSVPVTTFPSSSGTVRRLVYLNRVSPCLCHPQSQRQWFLVFRTDLKH